MRETETTGSGVDDEAFVRVPGLHRSWELQQLLEPRCELRVEEAGKADDGTPLFAVYRRNLDDPMGPPR